MPRAAPAGAVPYTSKPLERVSMRVPISAAALNIREGWYLCSSSLEEGRDPGVSWFHPCEMHCRVTVLLQSSSMTRCFLIQVSVTQFKSCSHKMSVLT